MSLTPTQLLAPRETIEHFNTEFEDSIKRLDPETLFSKIIGLETQKKILTSSIYAKDPVHVILIGPPSCGKSTFLDCIRDAFPQHSQFIDSRLSSGIGMIERIYEKVNRLKFLLVDKLEKFSMSDRTTLLGLLSNGTLSRNLKDIDSSYELTGLKIWFFSTCNNLNKMKKEQPEFLDRCEIIKVPELTTEQFFFIASKRIQREVGIHNDEIARYIVGRVFHDLGKENKSIRRSISVARLSYGRALESNNGIITKDIVDEMVLDIKTTMHTFD